MAEILVEFVPDFSKLENGVDKLVGDGTISKEMAAIFNDAGKSLEQFTNKFSKVPKQFSGIIQSAFKAPLEQAKKSFDDLSKSGIKDLGELKKKVDGITDSFTSAFNEGIEQALKEAGISMEDFNKALKLAQDSSEGLKTQLLEITKQLQVLKLNGEENSQQYSELAAKATLYRKAILDVSEQINKQASDTQKLDTAIEFVTGLTSAFAILQGVQALAGDQNEEFQKTLLKVQAAMSILVGLQQLQNILKKESNLIQFVENTQKKLGVAITALDSAAQSKNIIVKGAATLAQKALNAAMEANPAFILIGLFTALAGAISFFSSNTKDAAEETADLNTQLEITQGIIDRNIEKIKQEGELRLAAAKARGDSETQLALIELETLAKISDAAGKGIDANKDRLKNVLVAIQTQFLKTQDEMNRAIENFGGEADLSKPLQEFNKISVESLNNVDDVLAVLKQISEFKISDGFKKLTKDSKEGVNQIEALLTSLENFFRTQETTADDATKKRFEQIKKDRDNALADEVARQKIRLLNVEKLGIAELQVRKDLLQAELNAALNNDNLTNQQRLLLQKQFNEDVSNLNKAFNEQKFNDAIAQQKILLQGAIKGSQEELVFTKEKQRLELQVALQNDKLTFDQKRLLIQTFFKDQKELTQKFNEENRKKDVEDQLTNIKTQLNSLNISNEERTRLTIEQLQIEQSEELNLVVNNESKRKEIISRFEKEIFEVRKKSLQETQNEELENIRRNVAQRKAILESDINNEKLFAHEKGRQTREDEKKTFEARKAALLELSKIESDEFTQRRLNNQAQLKLAGINNIEALKEFAKNAKDIDNDQAAARKKNEETYTGIVETESEKRLRILQETVGKIADTANVIIDAFKTFNDSMNANEDARIQSQRDSLQRLRDLNALTEKEFIAKSKVIDRLERDTKQKQAEREKGIALFEAFVNGAAAIIKAAPNVPLIVATSILVAAQIAAIASRPIPKFGKGTEKAPKGLAQVGETGTEIITTEKGYYVAEHPQIVWFKGGEKVFNPKETKEIFKEKVTNNFKEKSFYNSKDLSKQNGYYNTKESYHNTNFELVNKEVLQTPQANMMIVNNSNGVSHETKFDIDKMAKKIGQEIAKHPRSIVNLDEDGFTIHIAQKLDRQNYLNKRFKF